MHEQKDPDERVRVIVGLGNPGRQYEQTRHNVGFQIIDRLAERCSIQFTREVTDFVWGKGRIAGREVYLLKPLTYMNRSGEAVKEFLAEVDLFDSPVLVIHDDLDLPAGRLKVVQRGGAGGHRGIASIIAHLEHQEFFRIKIGIGRPRQQETIEQFVLDAPYPEEIETYRSSLEAGVEAVLILMEQGIAAAMNRLNARASRDPQELPECSPSEPES